MVFGFYMCNKWRKIFSNNNHNQKLNYPEGWCLTHSAVYTNEDIVKKFRIWLGQVSSLCQCQLCNINSWVRTQPVRLYNIERMLEILNRCFASLIGSKTRCEIRNICDLNIFIIGQCVNKQIYLLLLEKRRVFKRSDPLASRCFSSAHLMVLTASRCRILTVISISSCLEALGSTIFPSGVSTFTQSASLKWLQNHNFCYTMQDDFSYSCSDSVRAINFKQDWTNTHIIIYFNIKYQIQMRNENESFALVTLFLANLCIQSFLIVIIFVFGLNKYGHICTT